MKSISAFLALALVVGAAAPLPAEEMPHLLLVQGLRDRRMPDLAIEYLQKLQANPPAELAKQIPLELARTRLELANLEPDAGRKQALMQQARGEFEAFVKSSAGDPLAASANLEIARIIGMQGKTKLSEARRQESAGTKKAMAGEARKLFAEAGTKLEDAAKQITLQLGNLPEMPTTPQERAAKQTLEQASLQAEFEQSMNLIDQAETFIGPNEVVQRGDKMKAAATAFGKLAGRDPRNPLCWQAQVWVGRSFQEIDNPTEALKVYDAVLAEKGDQVDAAKRIARYFRLLMIRDDQLKPDPKKDRAANIQKEGEDWLRDYRRYQYTPEGFGVRWEVGCACMDQAKKIPPGPMKRPTQQARDLYKLAETHFKILADTENDFTVRASNYRMQIILTTAITETGDDPDKLTKFEQCYIRAQYEAYQIEEEQKAYNKYVDELPPQPLPAQEEEKKTRFSTLTANRKKHYETVLRCVSRALQLAPFEKDVPPQDIVDVKSMRAFVHLALGNTYEAAILGEDLARTQPQSNRAAACAGYALQAYAQIAGKAESGGMMMDKDMEADRRNIRRLSEFMERTWPTDQATDFARHQLAAILIKEENYPLAVEVLGRISDTYGHLAQARYQLALTALDLAKDPEKLPTMTEAGLTLAAPAAFGATFGDVGEDNMKKIIGQLQAPLVEARRKYFHDRAVQALEGIPTVDGNADPDTAQVYLLSKLQLGNLLFDQARHLAADAAKAATPEDKAAKMKVADAGFDKLDGLADALTKLQPGLSLNQKTRDDVVPAVNALKLYSQYGRAAAHMAVGNIKQVLSQTDLIATEIKKGMDDGTLANDKFGALRRALVVVCLRANVQIGNVNRAKELLDILLKSAAQDQAPGGATAILTQIVQELREQIEQLTNDPDKADQLDKLKISIANFLDALAAQKDLPAETVLFLSSSYSSLDRADKALQLVEVYKGQFADPGAPPARPAPLTEAEEKDAMKKANHEKAMEAWEKAFQDNQRKQQVFRASRLLRIRLQRQAAAEFQGQEKKDKLLAARADLEAMLKEDWAKKSMDVRKERIQILEDLEAFGGPAGAIRAWDELMKQNPRNNDQMLVQYYDCYYHLVYCLYKNGLKIPAQAQRDASLKQAAFLIVKLEGGLPNMGADFLKKRYEELLKKEPLLKEWYLKEGGKALVAGVGK